MHKLMRYIKGYEKQALLAPLFKMLEACFELFVPLVIASIIDTGIKNEDAAFIWTRCGPVSYTHLDVYKRQGYDRFQPPNL